MVLHGLSNKCVPAHKLMLALKDIAITTIERCSASGGFASPSQTLSPPPTRQRSSSAQSRSNGSSNLATNIASMMSEQIEPRLEHRFDLDLDKVMVDAAFQGIPWSAPPRHHPIYQPAVPASTAMSSSHSFDASLPPSSSFHAPAVSGQYDFSLQSSRDNLASAISTHAYARSAPQTPALIGHPEAFASMPVPLALAEAAIHDTDWVAIDYPFTNAPAVYNDQPGFGMGYDADHDWKDRGPAGLSEPAFFEGRLGTEQIRGFALEEIAPYRGEWKTDLVPNSWKPRD